MNNQLLQFPAELISFKTYATKRNITCVWELQEEIASEDIAKLISAKSKTGWLVFSPSDQRVAPEDIPNEPVAESSSKTPSQRLRGVLFVYFKSLNRTESFDNFYQAYMEKVIDQIKAKLPPQE